MPIFWDSPAKWGGNFTSKKQKRDQNTKVEIGLTILLVCQKA